MAEWQRRKSVTVKVGNVRVGSDAPVVVQSMTNTDTADVEGTIQQVAALAKAGSELVRITVNNDAAAAAVPAIVDGLGPAGNHGSDCRRFPLQRAPFIEEVSGVCAGLGEVPDQSGKRFDWS